MWHDNETDIDLIGFGAMAVTLNELIQIDHLLPLTLGVFGDWGSGKSSLMRMSHDQIKKDNDYVCVFYSPWQHENYDDVKTALMEAVMKALQERRSLFMKLGDVSGEQVGKLWQKLSKRINWFKLITFAGKGLGSLITSQDAPPLAAGLAGSGLNDLKEVFTSDEFKEVIKEEDEKESETLEQGINEFRSDFAKLLQQLKIKALVVYIDDLDRCFPQTVIQTFETIRLFLAVPKTAFVLGADERIVRYAIATRYPDIAGQAVNIGRDYLEKIIQFPMRIPVMTPAETETYLNLLGCQLYMEKSAFEKVVEITNENRKQGVLGIAMNYGVLKSNAGFENVRPELEQHMQLVARIAPTLCGGLSGNPRQTKRFLNTLIYRQRLAKTRNQILDAAVLVKLMILEYFNEAFFRQLFEWQSISGGVVDSLKFLEDLALLQPEGSSGSTKLNQSEKEWVETPAVRAWLSLEPSLVGVNLQSYFYFSRDQVFSTTAPGRRLSQQQQEILSQLQDDADANRQLGLKKIAPLSASDVKPIYEELTGRFKRDPRAVNSKLGEIIVKIAADKRELLPILVQTLKDTPVADIQPVLATSIRNNFGVKAPLPRELEDIMQRWSTQTTNARLASTAKNVLKR